ncbi:MAG: hypothetical protein LBC80_04245 [Treponema sp.]|jgi:hypothetical protein|nr:hypothetical protein [Treponema sp.]
MVVKKKYQVVLLLLLFGITPFLYAQDENSEQLFTRRIAWIKDEHTWRYAIEVDVLIDETYEDYSREFTLSTYIVLSLPAGEYRFRIIPHDILDRPHEGTQWFTLVLLPEPPPVIAESEMEETHITRHEPEQIPDDIEQIQEPVISEIVRNTRFNTLGVSVGTTLTAPLYIGTLSGTLSLIQNFFIEFGFDFGWGYGDNFAFGDVSGNTFSLDKYSSYYPFAHFGYFMPYAQKSIWYLSVGGGYNFAKYTFSDSISKVNANVFNFTTGFLFADFFNVYYTVRFSRNAANGKFAVGYSYKFR